MNNKKKNMQIEGKIIKGLNGLRSGLISNKQLGAEYKIVITLINQITTLKKDIVQVITQIYLQLPVLVHMVNLIRWYGIYRNRGEYNKDAYVNIIRQIQEIKQTQNELLEKGKQLCPSQKALKQSANSIISRKKKLSETQSMVVSEIEKLFLQMNNEPDLQRQETKNRLVTNLLMQLVNKRLPSILPNPMENYRINLNDSVIAEDFEELQLELEPLSMLVPPQYNLQLAYPSNDIKLLDLVYMTLGYYANKLNM